MNFEFKKNDIICGNWTVEELIGKGGFGCVYKVYKEVYESKFYSAIKHIQIPNEYHIDMLKSNGIQSKESIEKAISNIVSEILNEINILYMLKGEKNIISYEDHEIVKDIDKNVFDIFIRMEYSTSVSNYIEQNHLKDVDVLKLGIDICSALEICHTNGIIHRDIKEDNIFISNSGTYKLGDFGVAKQNSYKTKVHTTVGSYLYLAPEVNKGEKYNETVDIYSLGIVLYKLLNNNKIPFLTSDIYDLNEIEGANYKRLNGEKLQKPVNMNIAIFEVINKACSYNSKDRYTNAKEFKNALLRVLNNLNKIDNKTITFKHKNSIKNNQKNFIISLTFFSFLFVIYLFYLNNKTPLASINPKVSSKIVHVKESNLFDEVLVSTDNIKETDNPKQTNNTTTSPSNIINTTSQNNNNTLTTSVVQNTAYPIIANAGDDITILERPNGYVDVKLDSSKSKIIEGCTYTWSGEFTTSKVPNPTIKLLKGKYVCKLEISYNGFTSTDTVNIEVIENSPKIADININNYNIPSDMHSIDVNSAIIWDEYTLIPRSYIDNRFGFAFLIYDKNKVLKQTMEISGTRYISKMSINTQTKTITIIGQDNISVTKTFSEISNVLFN